MRMALGTTGFFGSDMGMLYIRESLGIDAYELENMITHRDYHF